MEHPAQPSEIAREAIKRLATRKLPPTPENFRRAYNEVTGKGGEPPAWPQAIRDLLKQWDNYQAGLTQTKKRDMLERVLINFGNDPEQLADKLGSLARNWSQAQSDAAAVEEGEGEAGAAAKEAVSSPGAATAVSAATATTDGRLGELIAGYLQVLGKDCAPLWPDLSSRSQALAEAIAAKGHAMEAEHVEKMGRIWRELLVRAEDDKEYVGGLKRLLGLLFENVAQLVSDDVWLSGQMAAMRAALDGTLTSHALFEAERGLQEVVQRQQALKGSLNEAKEKLRQLISTFIDRVGEISDSTGDYHGRIQAYSERIAAADDISQLSDVIDGLSTDMQQMRDQMKRSHEELVEARNHVQEADHRIQALEKELEEVSNLVREDQLTGALNRRGMDEAFEQEIARAGRTAAPLSLSLLDIDHFKKLNDSLGHQAGDQALVHLARVVKKLLRPTDVLARYGGEEFLILLPNTEAGEGQQVMQRVQRELTKEYFLHDNQKVLITFSAGVAEMRAGENRDGLIARADAAMYKAKASGRNRVELAD
jgi:diguanylate cyclase